MGAIATKTNTLETLVDNYGAVGNGSANDQAAIQAAINAAGAGGVVRFTPGKNYKITSGLVTTYDRQVWMLHGATITVGFVGVGITVGHTTVPHDQIKFYGGRVTRGTIDWSSGGVGVRFLNTARMAWHDFEIDGFEQGLSLLGSNSQGCLYGTFVPRHVVSCKYGLHLNAISSGAVNENMFVGAGRIGYYSSDPSATGGYCVYMTCEGINPNKPNNNKFFGLSLENGKSSNKPRAVYCDGYLCQFVACRYEGFDNGFIECDTPNFLLGGNEFVGGFGLSRPSDNLNLPATAAAFRFAGAYGNYISGGSATDPNVTFQEVNSLTNVSWRLKNPNGVAVFEIRGDGRYRAGANSVFRGGQLQGVLNSVTFSSVPNGGASSVTVTVSGSPAAQFGNIAAAAFGLDSGGDIPAGVHFLATVTHAGQVTVTMVNFSGSTQTLGPGTVVVNVEIR